MPISTTERRRADGEARPGPVPAAGLAVLLATAAFPLAVLVRPESEPSAWPLLLPVVVAAALSAGRARGAGEDESRPTPPGGLAGRLAACAGAAVVLDAVWRLTIRWVALWEVPIPPFDGASLVTAGITAGGWYAGWRAVRPPAARDAAASGRALLAGGLAVVAVAGLAHAAPGSAPWQRHGVVAALLAYAVLAVAVQQRIHRRGLATAWAREGRPAVAAVRDNWHAWLLVVSVAAAAILALWALPVAQPAREAATGLPDTAREWLLPYLEAWEEPDAVVDRQASERAFHPGPDWFAVIVRGSAALVIAVILALAAVATVRGTGARRRSDGSRLRAWIRRVLRGLGHALRVPACAATVRTRHRSDTRAAVADPAGAGGRAADRHSVRRAVRPRSSKPREQVVREYRRVLETAHRQGAPRGPAESPLAYAATLRARAPERAPEVTFLTAAFVEARYSQHPIDPDTAARSKVAGRAVRKALRSG